MSILSRVCLAGNPAANPPRAAFLMRRTHIGENRARRQCQAAILRHSRANAKKELKRDKKERVVSVLRFG
jgi:hypothetical protein